MESRIYVFMSRSYNKERGDAVNDQFVIAGSKVNRFAKIRGT
jgi:hypothetical protein